VSEVFTVKSVGTEPREWSAHGSTFLAYKVDLEDGSGKLARAVEWNRKPESRAPQEGEQIAGHLEEGKYSEKFKLDFEATKELNQGGTGSQSHETSTGATRSAKGNWQPESERDPERAARILRQHSQEMALRYVALTGLDVDPENRQPALEQIVKPFIDWFDQDVIQTSQAVSSAQGPPPAGNDGAPSQSASPGSNSSPAEERTDVEMALSEPPGGKFLAAKTRELLTSYMLSQLQPDDLLRACNQLTNGADQSQQEQTLRAMKQRTERWKGEPLPADTDADEIPF
jgi:hypothetical protein